MLRIQREGNLSDFEICDLDFCRKFIVCSGCRKKKAQFFEKEKLKKLNSIFRMMGIKSTLPSFRGLEVGEVCINH